VRDGSKIRFLNDLWPDHLLKVTFPELFRITHCKEAMVANHVQFSNGNLHIIFLLLDQCMIRRWAWSLRSLISCILSGWDEVGRINMSDPFQGGRLSLDPFIMRFAFLLAPHSHGKEYWNK